MSRPEQLFLDLTIRPALGREDFVVTPSNAAALGLVETTRWPGGRLALIGPPASGKTHLAQVWAGSTGAVVLDAATLPRYDIATLAGAGRVVVEDVDRIGGRREVEAALFHLHNRLHASGGHLLVTGREAPSRWPIALPDLASRMSALTVAELHSPDDALLGALLEKQFIDRGMKADPKVLMYLVQRMPRTAEAAQAIAARIDKTSLARKVLKPGMKLAAEALEHVSSARHDSSSEGSA